MTIIKRTDLCSQVVILRDSHLERNKISPKSGNLFLNSYLCATYAYCCNFAIFSVE